MSNLPVADDTIQPKRNLMAERQTQKQQHDKKIYKHTAEGFRPRQRVALQDPHTKEWTIRGQIIEEVAPRSYRVQTASGIILRRNRRHIRKLFSTTSTTPNIQTAESAEPYEQLEDSDLVDNELQNDSDSDTIPYDLSDTEETANTNELNENEETVDTDELSGAEETADIKEPRITRSGRRVRDHRPLDYQDL